MISWATYSIMVKEKKINVPPFALLETLIFIGLIFLIPFYLLELSNAQYLNINIPVILTLGTLYFCRYGTYILDWCYTINWTKSFRCILHLMPIFSSLMAIFILGERLTFPLGASFIIFGIFLSTKFK